MVKRVRPVAGSRAEGRSCAVGADVGVFVVVNVDNLVGAEVDRVGAERPAAVEGVGVEDLEGEGDPAAGGAAVGDAGLAVADAAEQLFDVGDQLVRDGLAVGAVVGGVDLVGVAQGSVAVEVQEDHARGVVGIPVGGEGGAGAHHAVDGGVAGAEAANVDAQRVAAVGFLVETARQDDAGAEVDGASVEVAQELARGA